MGWSCSAEASDRLHDVWSKQCRGQTDSQNSYVGTDGRNYFYEVSRKEHDNGAITGTSWRELPDGEHVTRAGSWKINPDGTVARYPTAWPFPKDAPLREQFTAPPHTHTHGNTFYGVPADWFESPDPDSCHLCGTIAQEHDRYCAECGTRIARITDAPLFVANW
jgi:hypothetical protein